mgnify:CR=1 FL=1
MAKAKTILENLYVFFQSYSSLISNAQNNLHYKENKNTFNPTLVWFQLALVKLEYTTVGDLSILL